MFLGFFSQHHTSFRVLCCPLLLCSREASSGFSLWDFRPGLVADPFYAALPFYVAFCVVNFTLLLCFGLLDCFCPSIWLVFSKVICSLFTN